MIIFVKTLSGKLIPVQARPDDTIDYLKYSIFELEGYEPAAQKLIHLARILQDEHTLSEYGIRNESSVYLALEMKEESAGVMISSDVDITVKTLIGTSIPLTIQSYDTVKTVKYRLHKQLNIPVASQRLIFAGSELRDEMFLSNYSIHAGSTLYLVLKTSETAEAQFNPLTVHSIESLYYPSFN